MFAFFYLCCCIDLRFFRKKNSAALTSILDPRDELSAKDSSNAAAAVWYFVMNGHHITGNLNLLTDLTPVCDRWVRSHWDRAAHASLRTGICELQWDQAR